jgi:hypothetical protein
MKIRLAEKSEAEAISRFVSEIAVTDARSRWVLPGRLPGAGWPNCRQKLDKLHAIAPQLVSKVLHYQ